MKKRVALALIISHCLPLQAAVTIQQQVDNLWQQGAFVEAKQLLAPQVNKKTQDAYLLAALGRTELALGQTEQAEKLLARAISLKSTDAQYQFWYGRASCDAAQQASMFSALNRAKRCLIAFETAHQLVPDNVDYLQALAKYYAQAPSIAGGDKAKAMTLSKQLQALAPLPGQLLQLELLLQEEQTDAATAWLAATPALQSRPESYFLFGIKLAQARDYSAAINQFAKASEQTAVDEAARRSRLLALYQLGRAAVMGKTAYAQGITALETFLAAEPLPEFTDWAQFRLAQLYLATEQRPAAEALLIPLQARTADNTLKTEIKKIF